MKQLLIANQFNNDTLPDDLKCLFLHSNRAHDHDTRNSDINFFVPSISSTNFGELSLKHKVPFTWNEFSRVCPDIACKSFNCSKKIINNYFNCKYIKEEIAR